MTALQRTPLADTHVKLGARMVDFAGFEMPVQYSGILEEHRAVREKAGLFDVSHMGQLHLRGPGAVAVAERLVTCEVASLRPGRVRYGLMCNESGGVVDDVTVYRLAADAVFLCVNAANICKDREWVAAQIRGTEGAELEDRSEATGLIALQGPVSDAVLGPLAEADVAALPFFAFTETPVAGRPVLVSRTGYTGANGFEIYCDAGDVVALFETLLEAGAAAGVLPVGLGARDTLRLEAALPLYGHELDDTTTPAEAGLERFVKPGGWIGAEAAAGRPLVRRLAGFVLRERGVARADYPVISDGDEVGRVTSGSHSPTLDKSIGLAYVPPPLADPGAVFAVRIRGRTADAEVVEIPFVKRPPHKRGGRI